MIFGYDNDASIGGFAGFNHDDLENCYNTGNINIINNEGVAWVCGGIIGEWSGDENINNCYALGNISINMKDGSLIAGLAGNEEGDYKTILNINNCYSGYENLPLTGVESELITITNSGIKTPEEMKQDEFIDLLNNNNEESKWKKDTNNINKGFPILYFQ